MFDSADFTPVASLCCNSHEDFLYILYIVFITSTSHGLTKNENTPASNCTGEFRGFLQIVKIEELLKIIHNRRIVTEHGGQGYFCLIVFLLIPDIEIDK